ncbi:anaphase-promoting complex subunit cdc27 [Linderina pennispora]|nr:anaphase-promoting complex subunit cdc27 [Linderina pennispora]
MKREESLAQLAHDTISIGRTWSPEAWITVANCFSLDGDHQSALKSLRRSIQLYKPSPGLALAPRIDSGSQGGLAYAYTLSGHESTASDELDRAQQSFRTAVRVDSRHCNAWHGLGTVYLRLGKVDLAEYHFKRALSLNNQNPLLLQSAAAVFEARKDNQQALATYERIECMMQPVTVGSNRKGKEVDEEDGGHIGLGAVPTEQGILVGGLGSHHALNFVMFKRARILMILERYDEAAAVFECLLRRCPHEFNVPFLLGQAYTHLRRYREAAACLTRALDIAPENAPNVRELFDSLYQHHSPDEQGGSGAQNAAAGPQHEAAPDRTPDNKFTEHDPMVSTPQGSSPYFQSPALYAGRRGEQEWRQDWQALDNASDRVDRVLRFDLE